MPLLLIICSNAREREKVRLTLNANDPTNSKQNFLKVGQSLSGANSYKNEKVLYYTNDYAKGKAIFWDKVVIKWKIKETIKKITGTTIGAQSRRTKHRTKLKFKHVFSLEMYFPKSHYRLKSSPKSSFDGFVLETADFYKVEKKWKQKSTVKFSELDKGKRFDRDIQLDPFVLELKKMYQSVEPI